MSTTIRALHQSTASYNPNSLSEYSLKKDYMNICQDLTIVELLIEQGDRDPEGICLSDEVEIYNRKMKMDRLMIVVTKHGIHLLRRVSKKLLQKIKKTSKGRSITEWEMSTSYKLSDLRQIVVSSKNCSLAAFVFEKGNDFLMDSCRRSEIIAYVASMIKKASITTFKILYLNSFNNISKNGGGFGNFANMQPSQ